MMKLAGFLLLQLAALLFASQRVRGRYRQAEALRSYCAMLEQLRGILEAEASPMPELLQTLSGRCDGDAFLFVDALRSSMHELGALHFQDLWRKALNLCPACMDQGALRALDELGSVLGRYELPAQLQAVSNCLELLRCQFEQTQRELPDVRRLTWGLSLSGAMLFGIILF